MTVTNVEIADIKAEASRDPVSTPFANVDQLPASMRTMLLNALEGMAAAKEIGRVRSLADSMLQVNSGERILDAGCGAGEVARALAAAVGPDGQVTAVDASHTTIDHAESRDGGAGVQYRVADITALPLPDDSFDAVRCERVLQHVANADLGVAELIRVTRFGGRVCLIDTDWPSLTVDGIAPEVAEKVIGAFLNRGVMHHLTMGRTLRRRLVRAGLTDVSAQPITMSFADPASAAQILPLFNPEATAQARLIPEEYRERWSDAIASAAARNEFLVALTMWVAVGTRI
jgi:ubiquinone/menaquinone biosynthesis C-methylase UbiE